MLRRYLTMLTVLLLAAAVWAQEDENADDTGTETPVAEEAPATDEDTDEGTDEEIEELLGLDEDWSDAEDDDFNPSEEVRFEQNIAFPVDI